jgi:D-sedoheptulose 7-phosphate isomerase
VDCSLRRGGPGLAEVSAATASPPAMNATPSPAEHVRALQRGLGALAADAERIDRLGRQLARVARRGHRLLTVGGGASAPLASQMAARLVGRYLVDRPPLSAVALAAESAALDPWDRDIEPADAYVRQLRAHGRPGDALVAFSIGGTSSNVLAATEAALRMGLRTVGFTGRAPNPLAALCCDVVAADADEPITVLEIHHVALHLLCGGIDAELRASEREPGRVAMGTSGPRAALVTADSR